jgi:HD-GYP domain-containing protein (c-di-GMP phosphodiesterase class II)
MTSKRAPRARRGRKSQEILPVCDVYDALISTRVYRAAWSAEEALGLLFERAGSAFDQRVVEALARVLAREPASPLREAV